MDSLSNAIQNKQNYQDKTFKVEFKDNVLKVSINMPWTNKFENFFELVKVTYVDGEPIETILYDTVWKPYQDFYKYWQQIVTSYFPQTNLQIDHQVQNDVDLSVTV